MVVDEPRRYRKGFQRVSTPPADIQPAAEQRYGAAAATVASGRTFHYEWEDYVNDLTTRVEFIEAMGGITPGSGSGGSYLFDQATPAATWSITHSLATKPAVTVVVGGELLLAEVQYPSDSQVVVVFAQPTAGSAYLRG
jgi:hypothetical protein